MNDLTNMLKYANYREQMERLNRAMKERFFLEAMFIEYAVMEDRCESILTHAGVFRADRHFTIIKKIRRIEALTQSNVLAAKYFSKNLLERMIVWKDKRNAFIHALMKQVFTGDDLEEIVLEGQAIVKALCSKSTSYKRALERQTAKEAEENPLS